MSNGKGDSDTRISDRAKYRAEFDRIFSRCNNPERELNDCPRGKGAKRYRAGTKKPGRIRADRGDYAVNLRGLCVNKPLNRD